MNTHWRHTVNRMLAYSATLVVMLLMWLPVADPLPEIELWYEDKWEHLVVYGLLTWLWFRAGLAAPRAALVVGCCSIAFELGQLLVPYRSFDLLDLVANGVGCVLVMLLLRRTSFRQPGIPA